MKRPIWTAAVVAVAAMALGAVPAHAASPSAAVVAQAEGDPVDPPLFDETSGGGTVRVNVVTESRDDLAAAATAGDTVQEFNRVPVITLKVDRSGLAELAAQPGVVSVTEDIPVAPSLDTSVPLIGGDQAIKEGVTGEGSAIAVLDTGVATRHPFFAGRVVAESCFSPVDAAYGASSLCPDGSPEQHGTGAADSEGGPCATIDACEHGTHVAGIAAGNGAGIDGAPASGVAPGADLIAVQIFSKFDSEKWCGVGGTPCVRSFTSAQIAALEKVAEMRRSGTPVIAANLSFGGGAHTVACDNDARKPAIDSLLSAGVATVVAAGNNKYAEAVNSPACVSSAIAVGSSTVEDEVSEFSNHGALLDVFAPGDDIDSAVFGGAFEPKSGTSMATPHVAGAFAVLRQAHPDKDITELEALLKSTGRVIPEEGAGVPRVDIGKALGGTEPTPAPEPDAKPRSTSIVNATAVPIPDPGTVRSPITVTDIPGNAPKALQARVNLTHEWRGEVKIDLIAPDGKVYPLKTTDWTQNGGTINTTYTVDAGSSPAAGTWNLQVEDRSAGAVGTLQDWSLVIPTPFEKTGSVTIPDAGTLNSDIAVDGLTGNASGALQVEVDLTHEWLGDVKIDLLSPDGTWYPLKSTSATDTPLPDAYTVDASASPAAGTWRLRVQDSSQGATGILKGWALTFPSYENQVGLAIPDAAGLTSSITVGSITGSAPGKLRVYVDATHDWLGDMALELTAPNGTVHQLKQASATEAGGTLQRVYLVDASASPAAGTWKLLVHDVSEGSTGTLNGWALAF
ncbi:proprotein convertase P-domain-containing protein [Streptomyces sp. GESEQ-4]|uniref:proprotein convertase P-domain-containing protein n=1 Tax=Streptomyces sp. GESEQ-4 TaxID=2812655 RepID=UPI001B342E5F|nr:proprotein convertase P-domain-containing protein [Streptomyces sp. GESEQ-4]